MVAGERGGRKSEECCREREAVNCLHRLNKKGVAPPKEKEETERQFIHRRYLIPHVVVSPARDHPGRLPARSLRRWQHKYARVTI